MKYKATVAAIMVQNLSSLCRTGDPDDIYRLLTSELLDCKPDDLLFLLSLLREELEAGTDASFSGLNALTNRFFDGLCDVLYGILAERIEVYKEANDFRSLRQIFGAAIEADPKILHEVGQMVYQDNYAPEIIERAQKSSLYKYHDEIDEHFRTIQKRTEEGKENEGTDQIHEVPDWHHPAKAEIRMIRLIDVVSCYIDANPENLL